MSDKREVRPAARVIGLLLMGCLMVWVAGLIILGLVALATLIVKALW